MKLPTIAIDQVEPDGTYIAPKHSKLGFGTMVFVRSIMIKDQATQLGAAATIAIRYAAIRRQGEKEPGLFFILFV